MAKGFAKVPREAHYVLANTTVPAVLVDGLDAPADIDGLVRADITIRDGKVERIDPAGRRSTLPKLDLDRGMVWPGFVDMHTHIDKGHIWPRQRNPNGSFQGALAAVTHDREMHWKPHDVERRMDFALRSAYAHGTVLLRTHLDSAAPQHRTSWPVFADMRARWAGKIDLQAVSILGIEHFLNRAYADDLVDVVAEHGGVLGAVTFMMPGLDTLIEAMMERAGARGLDLDFHVDETQDPEARSLRAIADAALRTGYEGQIVVGHCCSLARQPDAEANETMDRVARAGIAVVSLPMCNMYLQDREEGRTPRWRGITLLHEFADRGVAVSVASDNTRDPFYAYGDLDVLEVFREATRIAHFDHPFGRWPATVARTPAAVLRQPDRGVIAAGSAADLVLFNARTYTELLSRPQADRTVLRAGKPIDRRLPDYRELDDIMKTA